MTAIIDDFHNVHHCHYWIFMRKRERVELYEGIDFFKLLIKKPLSGIKWIRNGWFKTYIIERTQCVSIAEKFSIFYFLFWWVKMSLDFYDCNSCWIHCSIEYFADDIKDVFCKRFAYIFFVETTKFSLCTSLAEYVY